MTLLTLLEVFPGWPAAGQGSALDYALLLFIGPLALGAVVSVMFNASRWSGKGATTSPVGRDLESSRTD